QVGVVTLFARRRVDQAVAAGRNRAVVVAGGGLSTLVARLAAFRLRDPVAAAGRAAAAAEVEALAVRRAGEGARSRAQAGAGLPVEVPPVAGFSRILDA